MNAPKVSIIVPMYNSENTIKQCIESLICQTLKDIEIILVNDNSPDNCLVISQYYVERDPRIFVINSEKNHKLGGARNRGILAAKAEYISFVDADDWVEKNMFELLYNQVNNDSIDVVLCDYFEYNGDDNITKATNIPIEIVNSNVIDIHKYVLINGARLWSLWRKDLIISNNLLFLEDNMYDFIGYTWFLVAKKIIKIDKPFYYYRNIRKSDSINNKKDNFLFFDRLNEIEYTLQKIKELDLYTKYEDEIDYFYYRSFYHLSLAKTFTFSKLPVNIINDIFNRYKFRDKIKSNKYYLKKRAPIGLKAKLVEWLYENVHISFVKILHKLYITIK